MHLFPYQTFPNQQNRHTIYQVSLTIFYPWPSLQIQAVKFFSPDRVSYNGDIILRGWQDPTTRLLQVPIQSDEGNIVPHNASIVSSTEPTPQANSMYECENKNQLINFYYATIGYPVVSTWYKAIDKGDFRGWNDVKASDPPSHQQPPWPQPQQLPLNDKTNMMFMTMVDIQGQLFTDQTGRFLITSNRGNNYIVIFYTVDANHIKSYTIKSCQLNSFVLTMMCMHTSACKNIDPYTNSTMSPLMMWKHLSLRTTPASNIPLQKSIKPTLPIGHPNLEKPFCCHASQCSQILPPLQLVQRYRTNRHHPQYDVPMHTKPKPLCA
ncbi:LOW QUALITY PROTEIN: hypothetical protein ACHAW6_001856 [Cyclotella cf. meneghiniana]